jgi:D-amino-acid oxidase
MTYTIEPVKLMPYLVAEFKSLGGKIVTGQRVKNFGELTDKFDLIINCTGVWASELTKDTQIAPLRGQVMRVKAPWLKRVILDDLDDGNYIIPK